MLPCNFEFVPRLYHQKKENMNENNCLMLPRRYVRRFDDNIRFWLALFIWTQCFLNNKALLFLDVSYDLSIFSITFCPLKTQPWQDDWGYPDSLSWPYGICTKIFEFLRIFRRGFFPLVGSDLVHLACTGVKNAISKFRNFPLLCLKSD